MVYEIVEWQQRYEVNIRGEAAVSGDKLRKAPLTYYRSKVNGTCQGLGYRKLLGIAGGRALEVFGIFHKMLEIAAGQDRSCRGRINNSISELAMIIGIDEQNIEKALSILSDNDLGWLRKITENPESSGRLRKITEASENSVLLYNETKRNETKRNETEQNRTERKGNSACELLPSEEVVPDGVRIRFDFLKEDLSSSVRTSIIALHWHGAVRPLLFLKSPGDLSCLRDIQRWLTEQINTGECDVKIFDNAWQWAKDAKSGEVPISVFQARLKKELGYECKSKREV